MIVWLHHYHQITGLTLEIGKDLLVELAFGHLVLKERWGIKPTLSEEGFETLGRLILEGDLKSSGNYCERHPGVLVPRVYYEWLTIPFLRRI